MDALVRVANLKKYFPISHGLFGKKKAFVRAVDDISFDIKKGETVGLVGESGCGKSTVGRTILRLTEPTAGKVFFGSENIFQFDRDRLRDIRKEMAIIFQDPYSSINPRLQLFDIVAEPLKTHTRLNAAELRDQVLELLLRVGLAEQHLNRYPHEFSGGQRQRISIARALALNPSLLILDEPTSALDVSVQAQVLNLIVDLQQKLDLTYLFISHNLAVVEHISHRVIIMYLGKIVEMAYTRQLFSNPLHPYSEALLSAIPNPDIDQQTEQILLKGDVPSPIRLPGGCNFHTRCPYAYEDCKLNEPPLAEVEGAHFVACHLRG
ncbi:MAG: dipeptide ABC transporter ATP-binding protein [Desulfobacterales bacterium]|nr:MAG: dipeptide ABC transporter ATP-binding protein [Desulfobacterales bacterium]